MKRKVKNLIEGGRATGDTVGRLLLADMGRYFWKLNTGDQNTADLLTLEEKNALRDALETDEDRAVYGLYLNAIDFLSNLPARYNAAQASAICCANEAAEAVRDCIQVEERERARRADPLRVSAEKYQELRERSHRAKLAEIWTREDALRELLAYYVGLYQAERDGFLQNGPENPLRHLLEAADGEPLENPAIIENYHPKENPVPYDPMDCRPEDATAAALIVQTRADLEAANAYTKEEPVTPTELYRTYEAHEKAENAADFGPAPYGYTCKASGSATKYGALRAAGRLYFTPGGCCSLADFAADYPAIYAALAAELRRASDPAADRYPVADLYAAGLPAVVSYVDNFDPADKYTGIPGGLAVYMPTSTADKAAAIDPQTGYFLDDGAPESSEFAAGRAEQMLHKRGENIAELLRIMTHDLELVYACKVFVTITADRLRVPDLCRILAPVDEGPLQNLQRLAAAFPYRLYTEAPGRDLEKLRQNIRQALEVPTFTDLQANKREVSQARRLFRLSLFAYPDDAMAFLFKCKKGAM